mgnify:CR=1 FL=1
MITIDYHDREDRSAAPALYVQSGSGVNVRWAMHGAVITV